MVGWTDPLFVITELNDFSISFSQIERLLAFFDSFLIEPPIRIGEKTLDSGNLSKGLIN